MKLRHTLLTILLATCSLNYAMMAPLCKMPSAGTLEKYLEGHKGIIANTNLINDLADKELSALQVVTLVEQAINDYRKSLLAEQKDTVKSSSMAQMIVRMLPERKNTIVALLLKEYPKEYESVKQLLIKKTAKL